MLRASVALLIALFGVTEVAAETACTEMGCQSGVRLDVAPDYRWPPGSYVFDFDLDGARATCRGALPLPPCEQSGLTCDNAAIMILQSGCALPPESHGFGMITIDGAPAKVRVTITRDGAPFIDKTLSPVYQDVYPNGRQCDPVCHQASAVLLGQ